MTTFLGPRITPATLSVQSTRTREVMGANLFKIAMAELGDATQWNRLAALNKLWDYEVAGPLTLKIPPVDRNAGNGGILGV